MSFPPASSASGWQQGTVFSNIPPHCEPSNNFLAEFSSFFHSCIPTPLAFVSTVLGFFSIACWLFAQLPQIYKNYRLRSTSGLSIFFLVEWCLGDMSNFFGAMLTEQAAWQIIVGAYYCSVDLALVSQWIWFEGMGNGYKNKPARSSPNNEYDDGKPGRGLANKGGMAKPQQPHAIPASALKDDFFNTPTYGSIPSSDSESQAPSTPRPALPRTTMPRLNAHNLPSPSPRTTLFLTLLVALASATASPTSSLTQPPHAQVHPNNAASALGTILSWLSTILYLLSRVPQLLKNLSRRSTAGLSPLLFLAAFFGNLFYSTSLLCNPSLWRDLGPYGGGGWAGPRGSTRDEWATRALPFFLGAAGVLVMDAAVGVQFWLWSESRVAGAGDADGEGASGSGGSGRGARDGDDEAEERTRGWMRGWVPSGTLERLRRSVASSTTNLVAQGRRGLAGRREDERLLGTSSAAAARTR